MHQVHIRDNRGHAEQLTVQDAASIPAIGHAEAVKMGSVELERFLSQVESLAPNDWEKPTACTMWDVREMVAHVAGAAASFADRSEFRRQNSPRVQSRYRKAGLSRLDTQNQIQVDDRAAASSSDLIAELHNVGPRAVAARQRMPALVRSVRLPLGLFYPMDMIWVPIGYMANVIITRDMWMHRLDICRATDREMELTAEHDGRITRLVVRDLSRRLSPRRGGASVVYELSGPAGGAWRIGNGVQGATIRMDTLDFHLLASGRMPLDEARSLVEINGDGELANRALERTWVVY